MPCRVRLYVDESGNAGPPRAGNEYTRYLGVVGVAMSDEYGGAEFGVELAQLKSKYFTQHGGAGPVIIHREDMIAKRGPFTVLQDPAVCAAFDDDLLGLIGRTKFVVFGVVLDKRSHRECDYRQMTDAYHYCTVALLERYCGRLLRLGNVGDVLAESRGGNEDLALKTEFNRVVVQGDRYLNAEMRARLTSTQLKLKQKKANIAGLQLADLVANPATRETLHEAGRGPAPTGFGARLREVLEPKYNRHLYNGRVKGYGRVLLV